MMRVSVFLATFLITVAALGESPRINVPRPPYAYEVLDAIPSGMSLKADRSEIARFLDEKQLAKTNFAKGVHRACLPHLSGDLSAQDFAAKLDRELQKMREAMSAAYDRMSAQLSASGQSVLRGTISQSGRMSADTVAVDVVAASPVEAESLFKILCDKALTP